MTGLKIVAGLLVILLAIPYIVFLYMGIKMEKDLNEVLEKEWEELKK